MRMRTASSSDVPCETESDACALMLTAGCKSSVRRAVQPTSWILLSVLVPHRGVGFQACSTCLLSGRR